MLWDSPMLQRRWAGAVSHIAGTVLPASVLASVFWSGQYPFVQHWLTAKVLALLACIGLGTVAFKHSRTKGARAFALLAALVIFTHTTAVAQMWPADVMLQALGPGR